VVTGTLMTDDPARTARSLADALRAFHKTLIDAALAEASNTPANPFARLTALMRNPAFAWLQPLSMLVANTDHVVRTASDLTDEVARDLRRSTEAVVGPTDSEEAGELRRRIGELTPAYPEVGIALAEVRQALARLPEA